MAADWRVGKVEHIKLGRDGKVREVGIGYKIMKENDDGLNSDYDTAGTWSHNVVERPVRHVVRLMNIEGQTFDLHTFGHFMLQRQQRRI